MPAVNILRPFYIFYVIYNIFPVFGILCQEKSGNPDAEMPIRNSAASKAVIYQRIYRRKCFGI
jgi:hypothetical protein